MEITKRAYSALKQRQTFTFEKVKTGVYGPGIEIQDLGNDLPGCRFEPTDLVYIRCNFDGSARLSGMLTLKYIERKPLAFAIFIKKHIVHHRCRCSLYTFIFVDFPKSMVTEAYDFSGQ